MRRGMTMVELMFSLSLLTVLAVAIAAWTQIAAKAAAGASGPDHWRAAAEAVIRLVHDDIAAGDLDARRSEPRARIVDGVLEIRTRASAAGGLIGPVVCRYRREPTTDQLLLEQRSPDGTHRTRLLLDHVRRWDVAIDDQKLVLAVTIAAAGSTVGGRFVLR